MASEAVFLLWVLATLVVALVVIRREPGFRWLWGWHLQMAGVLALCGLGLTVGPPGPLAAAAWALFLAVSVGPTLIARRLTPIVIVEVDPVRAVPYYRALDWLSWGPPAGLRAAELEALRAAAAGDRAGALEALSPYLAADKPDAVRGSSAVLALSILRVDEAWDEAIAFSEAMAWPTDRPVPHGAAFVAARAYLERGRFAEAVAQLARADLGGIGLPGSAIDSYHLPFLALLGDLEGVEALGRRLGPRQAEFVLAWRARCLAVLGRHDEALSALRDILAAAPTGSTLARRLARMVAQWEAGHWPPGHPASEADIEAVRRLFAGARQAAPLFETGKPSKLVLGLMAVNAVAFVALYGPEWVGNKELTERAWTFGVMWMPALQAGEWWRLLTHQYMHANWIHLGINLAALWAVGTMTVRLLGALPVLALYTLAGVAGGLVQGWLSPQAACLGASGAVMGTLGALGVAVWRAGDRLPVRWRARFLKRFALLVLLQFGADTLIPGVAAADHGAGLLAGALLALCLPVRLRAGAADEKPRRPIGEVSPSGG